MNAGIQASNIESAVPIQVLFKAGQFVRVMGGNVVGRVLEDTPDENSSTRVQIFDDDSWGAAPTFGPGALTMWTPDEVRRVPARKKKPAPKPPLDLDKVDELLMKIIGYSELAGNLGDLELNSGERDGADLLPFHLKLIGSAIDRAAGDLLNMIENEKHRLWQAA